MSPLFLSLFFGYHDSSVTIADDERVLLHLEAERYFRRKHCVVSPTEMDELVAVALGYVGGDIRGVEEVYLSPLKNPLSEERICVQGREFRPIMVGHHNCHIATAKDPRFVDALIVVADGGSEDGSTRVYFKSENRLEMVANLDDTAANGKFYGSLTMMVIDPDFMKAHGWYSGKTMGLAAYGRYREDFARVLEELLPDLLWGCYLDVEKARARFGLGPDYSRPWLDERRRDLACTGQELWTQAFLKELGKLRHLSGNLVMVGGCALNVLLNSALVDSGLFDRVHVGPASGDCGQSLGAILHHHPEIPCPDAHIGRGFGEVEEYPNMLGRDLLEGHVVAWYQGRSEIGPRALGHRSLLALPAPVSQRDRMNTLKAREPYRPVAPIVPAEAAGRFFSSSHPSPYMSFAPRALAAAQEKAPAIVHADGTARLQTLTQVENPILHRVLLEIGETTGAPILINTSFNFDGEPIVDTPEDALKSFRRGAADVLYVNGERYSKE